MLFIDVLVLFIFLERTVSRHIDQKRSALAIACENQRRFPMDEATPVLAMDQNLLPQGDRFFFAKASASTPNDGQPMEMLDGLEKAVYQTLKTGLATTRKAGKTVGLLFLQHKSVILTYPILSNGNIAAAGGIESSLAHIYQDFRRIQKISIIFVVINSFFFALFGNRQLTRIYFKPLKRLAKKAESYQDEGTLFFSVRKEDNEFSVLSSSLNKMLDRIAEDKRVLNETIGSLKAANVELKKAQNDVIRAEKLATVGRLTSGIAHEIGNPIGIVLGYLDLLKQMDLTPGERNDFIARSEKEITRINHIIRQLLDMSRSTVGESKAMSIHQLLQDLIVVLGYQPAADAIGFDLNLDATDDIVFADPDRLRQVFLNILLNAVDAVSGNARGDERIKIITECTTDDNDLSSDPDGGFIKVTIQDSGPGIDPSHLPHVFDPFFTTKPPGKGTGLGLSVSFMIVEKLGGHITVSGGKEVGAVFQVVLPLARNSDVNGIDRKTGAYGNQ
ncbi:sensor histidine kinase [Desulfosarcina sp.]|uniref:sensor histidine kinase n=1 Tax=Desulfosarcina sp. TaxID=2027861 RepID=UPI0035692172